MAIQALEDKHPELFQSDAKIDRRSCKRVIPMQVLSLGFSRTGTACKLASLSDHSFVQFIKALISHTRCLGNTWLPNLSLLLPS